MTYTQRVTVEADTPESELPTASEHAYIAMELLHSEDSTHLYQITMTVEDANEYSDPVEAATTAVESELSRADINYTDIRAGTLDW